MRKLTTILVICLTVPLANAQELALVKHTDSLTAVEAMKSHLPKGYRNHIVPFELIGGLIFVAAASEGEKAKYILDSGAPSLIVNSVLLEKDKDKRINAIGLSGKTHIENIPSLNFEWAGESIKPKAYKMDISHLEAIKKMAIGGLIGYDLLKEKEILINYKTKEISIYEDRDFTKEKKPKLIIPFKMEAHFAVIEAKIGRKKYRFALDTGAEANLLDSKYLSKIKRDNVGELHDVFIQGTDKKQDEAQFCTIKETKIRGEHFNNMDYVFTSIDRLNKMYNMKIDGLLGFPFLSNKEISIDYKRNKIYVWE